MSDLSTELHNLVTTLHAKAEEIRTEITADVKTDAGLVKTEITQLREQVGSQLDELLAKLRG